MLVVDDLRVTCYNFIDEEEATASHPAAKLVGSRFPDYICSAPRIQSGAEGVFLAGGIVHPLLHFLRGVIPH